MQKPSLLFTEVSTATIWSLYMHDVMVVCGECMANFVIQQPEGVLWSNAYVCCWQQGEQFFKCLRLTGVNQPGLDDRQIVKSDSESPKVWFYSNGQGLIVMVKNRDTCMVVILQL